MLSPPFPDDVPTHPLLVIDYRLLQEGDAAEKERLWGSRSKAWLLVVRLSMKPCYIVPLISIA